MMSLSPSVSLTAYKAAPPHRHPQLVTSLSLRKYGITNSKSYTPRTVSHSKVVEFVKASGLGADGTTSDVPLDSGEVMMPQHVALILDDHRAWGAGQEELPVEDRLKAGRTKIVEMARFFQKIGIKVFTVFAPSVHDLLHTGGHDDVGQLKTLFEGDFAEAALDKIME